VKLYVSGFAAFARGDYEAALADWERSLTMNPTLAEDAMLAQVISTVRALATLRIAVPPTR
jgi:cytochrome c-type biogenesis protein CcmH/NrfG